MIFVDTSFWVAIRNRRDSHHEQAQRLLRRHADAALLTSNQIRGETWTFLRRRAGHASAVDFLHAIDHSPRLQVIQIGEDLESEALRWLRRHDEREYSFVDATSFAVMRARKTRKLWHLAVTSRPPASSNCAIELAERFRGTAQAAPDP